MMTRAYGQVFIYLLIWTNTPSDAEKILFPSNFDQLMIMAVIAWLAETLLERKKGQYIVCAVKVIISFIKNNDIPQHFIGN